MLAVGWEAEAPVTGVVPVAGPHWPRLSPRSRAGRVPRGWARVCQRDGRVCSVTAAVEIRAGWRRPGTGTGQPLGYRPCPERWRRRRERCPGRSGAGVDAGVGGERHPCKRMRSPGGRWGLRDPRGKSWGATPISELGPGSGRLPAAQGQDGGLMVGLAGSCRREL